MVSPQTVTTRRPANCRRESLLLDVGILVFPSGRTTFETSLPRKRHRNFCPFENEVSTSRPYRSVVEEEMPKLDQRDSIGSITSFEGDEEKLFDDQYEKAEASVGRGSPNPFGLNGAEFKWIEDRLTTKRSSRRTTVSKRGRTAPTTKTSRMYLLARKVVTSAADRGSNPVVTEHNGPDEGDAWDQAPCRCTD